MSRRARGARASRGALGASLLLLATGGATARAAIPYEAEITPGALRGIAWEPGDPWPAGYMEYLPSNFDEVPPDHRYPLLLTLGGIGTMDDVSSCPGNADWCTVAQCEASFDGVCRAYGRGPGVEIRQGVWDDVERPFLVISLQNSAPTSSSVDYDRDVIDAMVTFVLAEYPVDPRRMYLLGNSQGGRGVLQYTSLYSRRMAAVTMGPGGMVADGDAACRFEDTAFWAFHGENDDDANIGVGVFDPCWVVDQVRMYDQPDDYPMLAGCVERVGVDHPQGRLTMFDDTAHNAWTPAFENIANGFSRSVWLADQACGFSANFYDYSAAMDPDGVYSWLLSFDRPDTDAGEDLVVPGDQTQFALVATTVDDDPVSYAWTQLEGPAVTLRDADQAEVTITDFEYDQTYTFEVYALDADQQWDRDEVVVTVEAEVESASTGGDPSTSGGSESGVDDTSGGEPPGASTSGEPVPADGSGTGAGEGSSSGTGSGGADEDAAGCGCSTRGEGWSGSLGWLVVGMTAVRRRRGRERARLAPSSPAP